jgi:hypothetical protein
MRNAILVDINGTLSDVSKVIHFIQGPDKDWEGFFGNMNNVPPNRMVKEFVNAMRQAQNGFVIVLVSGAPDRYKNQTINWLRQHSIKYDDIFFRPEWDKRRGWQFKKTIYEKKIKNLYNVRLVLDDKADACKTWTDLGLECWNLPSDMDDANRPQSNEPGKRFAHLVRGFRR